MHVHRIHSFRITCSIHIPFYIDTRSKKMQMRIHTRSEIANDIDKYVHVLSSSLLKEDFNFLKTLRFIYSNLLKNEISLSLRLTHRCGTIFLSDMNINIGFV